MSSWILQYLQPDTPADATATKLPRQLRAMRSTSTIGPRTPGNFTPDKASEFVNGSGPNSDTPQNWLLNYLTPVGAMRAGAHLANTIDEKGVLSKSTAGEAAASSLMFLPEGTVSGVFKKLLGKAAPFERFAVISAENPGGKAASAAINDAANARLESALRKEGYKPIPTTGRYPDERTGELLSERGFMVPGMAHNRAEQFGRDFGQNSVLTDRGLHDLVDSKIYPATGLHPTGAEDVAHTELPNGQKFSMNLNFENPVAQPKPSPTQLASVGVRPPGFGPANAHLPSGVNDQQLNALLSDAANGPHPTSDAARASARALPTDMEIPAGVKRAATDSVVERIGPAAIRGQSGQIYSGPTHGHALNALIDAGDRHGTDLENDLGFLTNTGRYVNTEEAYRLADLADQLRPKAKAEAEAGAGKFLHSNFIKPATRDINAPSVITAPNSGDVFDVSKLGLNVPAGVSTDRPPLKRPTRADLSSLSGVPRKFREVYTPNAERAMRETPEAAGWYDMSQVRDAMSDLSPEGADDFKKFMLFMGPTSIGTKVPDNLRQASKFFQLYKNGELDLNALKNGTLELPQGYANRRQKSVNSGITKIMETGNLDPYSTPKTFRYANQLAGDMWGGAALDMHVGRQVGKRGLIPDAEGELVPETGFPAPSYSKENPMVSTSPSPTQYAHIEDSLVRQASNLGLTPAQYQALGWVGGGAQTGVSDTRPLLSIFNQKLKDTAAKYGFNSPMDAFTAFAQGKTPLWAMLPAAAMGGGLLYGNDQQR